MKKTNDVHKTDEERLFSGILRLNAKILGLALGMLLGLAVFIATNWLVLKGGNPMRPHLQLLGQYFLGYWVSFVGSLIGFAYGFALGTLCGASIGWIYNKIVVFMVFMTASCKKLKLSSVSVQISGSKQAYRVLDLCKVTDNLIGDEYSLYHPELFISSLKNLHNWDLFDKYGCGFINHKG